MCSRSERVNPATTHCRMIKLPLLSHRAPVLLRECGRPFFVPARRPCFRVSGGCGSTFIINRYAFAVPFYLILGETTPGAYPMPFYAVRATTSLRGERAQQAAYSLPSQRFSLALSFPHPPLSFGETSACDGFQDFMRQTLFNTVL